MIAPPLKGTTKDMNNWKRKTTYNKFPIFLWKLLCKLRIKHNWLLIEWHTYDFKRKKEIPTGKQFGIEQCVYCNKKRRIE